VGILKDISGWLAILAWQAPQPAPRTKSDAIWSWWWLWLTLVVLSVMLLRVAAIVAKRRRVAMEGGGRPKRRRVIRDAWAEAGRRAEAIPAEELESDDSADSGGGVPRP
jgi:hypothetical protein